MTTREGVGMTMREDGMMTNERFRGRGAPGDGRAAPRLPYPPGASSVSEAGTYWGASVRESGNLPPPSDDAAPPDPADVPLDRFFIRF